MSLIIGVFFPKLRRRPCGTRSKLHFIIGYKLDILSLKNLILTNRDPSN